MNFTLDSIVSAGEVVQGLCGTARDAMSIGQDVFAAAVRDVGSTLIEDMKVVSN